jgi:phosphocarrier protein HPr
MADVRATLTIRNKLGLHARAAAMFVNTVARFTSEILVEKDGQSVNGGSIMGLMTLAAEQGSQIDVLATGADAAAALEAIRLLVESRFSEGE